MEKNIQNVRGMRDYLSEEVEFREKIEGTFKKIIKSYGYKKICFPILEKTSLFHRTLGKFTDIIRKETYTFLDRNGESLTLRPEGTAGCVRAGIKKNLFSLKGEQKLWYMGPMFRYEKPQKGRYRQFYQIGIEVFGNKGPNIDVEIILMNHRWWKELGIQNDVALELNSVGSEETKLHYSNELRKYFKCYESQLNQETRIKINNNPIRILDSKDPKIQKLLKKAPDFSDFLDQDSSMYFQNLCVLLNSMNIEYKINPHLVRGLDYYNHTVFEWINKKNTCSQNAICGGGRYDKLIEKLGGPCSIPAIGCSVGVERLIHLIKMINPNFYCFSDTIIYIITENDKQIQIASFLLSEKIRDSFPNVSLVMDHHGGDFKKQFSRANKKNAYLAIILGKNEFLSETISIKNLHTGNQITVSKGNVIPCIKDFLQKK